MYDFHWSNAKYMNPSRATIPLIRPHRCDSDGKGKGKGMVLYSAVSSPLDRSKRFTLSSPGRPVHSDTVLGFSWKHSSHAAIAQRLFTHISTTVYSQSWWSYNRGSTVMRSSHSSRYRTITAITTPFVSAIGIVTTSSMADFKPIT